MTRISSGYSNYSATALANLLSHSKARTNSTSSNPNLLTDQPSQNAVVNKIEKHIDDVKKGNGDVSRDVPYLLGQQDSNTSTILSQTNPKALAMYSGYLSGLRYDRAARFVNGVDYNLTSLAQIGKAETTES